MLLLDREEAQARREEAEFMRWWAAEEERIKAESAVVQEGAEGDKKAKRSRERIRSPSHVTRK